MAVGDHIKVLRKVAKIPIYWHHGIEVRGEKVVHYGDAHVLTKKNGIVIKSTMEEFLRGGKKVVENSPNRDSVFMILSRVYTRLKEKTEYNIIFNNCESFAKWAETGEASSGQVSKATKIGIGLAGIAAGVLLRKKLWDDKNIVNRIDLLLR
ncbi:MAG: lecithin retinol acyltransferase family protein [Candidatus Shapirobacteria bacterium]